MLEVESIRDDAACARNRKRAHKYAGYPCLICDSPCEEGGNAVWVYLHDGGSAIVTEAEYEAMNADGQGSAQMGAYPIGPNCYRKHKDVLEPYVIRKAGGVK